MNGPNEIEIQAQMKRLASVPLIRKQRKKLKMLEFVVSASLEKRKIDGQDIGDAVWSEYDPYSTKVRTTATLLRGILSAYYQTEGINDLVVIDLPAGPGYEPAFSYNRDSKAVKLCKTVQTSIDVLDGGGLNHAALLTKKAVNESPEYGVGWLIEAKRSVVIAVVNYITDAWVSGFGPSLNPSAAQMAAKLMPESGEPLLVEGVTHALRAMWHDARSCVNKALQIDAEGAKSSPWYATYLAMTENTATACKIMNEVSQSEGDRFAISKLSEFLLYADRRYLTSQNEFLAGVGDGHVISGALLAAEEMAMDNLGDALQNFRLASGVSAGWEYHDLTQEPVRFLGLMIYCLKMMEEDKKASKQYERLQSEERPRCLQLAFAHLAFGKEQLALKALCDGFAEADDLSAAWISALPLFDPFRKVKGFEDILRVVKAGRKRRGIGLKIRAPKKINVM